MWLDVVWGGGKKEMGGGWCWVSFWGVLRLGSGGVGVGLVERGGGKRQIHRGGGGCGRGCGCGASWARKRWEVGR